MRIAIDGTTLCAPDGSRGAGIEHYTWSITEALLKLGEPHEFIISTPPSLNRVRQQELLKTGARVSYLNAWGPRLSVVSRHAILPLRFWLRHPDVLFAPFGQIPLGWRGKSVVTVHDLAIYTHPDWFPAQQDFSTRVVVPRSIERATQIIAVSSATQQALHEHMPFTAGRVHVVFEGVDLSAAYEALHRTDATSSRFPFDRDFVLFLGTIEPRKNLLHAFRAFDAFLKSRPDQATQVRFIVAGKRGWHTQEIEQEAISINHSWKGVEPGGMIQFLGPVTEEEKWHLLAHASCLFCPSWDEGFGLPLLEAMAVGTPTIASNRGALPEVGGDAAVYVDPEDIEAMSFALTQCLLIPEGVQHIRELGLQRAAELSWERAAKETMKIITST
jgi:glycosyltransferase involved in cell wall biosynthesis